MPTKEILSSSETKMKSAIDSLDHHLQSLRTGRASAQLLENVKVESYGQQVPLNQVAAITTPDARSLLVAPWDKSQMAVIEKALIGANLGMQPMNDGKQLRLVVPALTEERRKELVKKAHAMAEDSRVAIRNVRKHAKETFDKMKKAKELTEDQHTQSNDQIQKLTDKYVAKVDEVLKKKEKDIMEV